MLQKQMVLPLSYLGEGEGVRFSMIEIYNKIYKIVMS
jgi:hypothetical protein